MVLVKRHYMLSSPKRLQLLRRRDAPADFSRRTCMSAALVLDRAREQLTPNTLNGMIPPSAAVMMLAVEAGDWAGIAIAPAVPVVTSWLLRSVPGAGVPEPIVATTGSGDDWDPAAVASKSVRSAPPLAAWVSEVAPLTEACPRVLHATSLSSEGPPLRACDGVPTSARSAWACAICAQHA